MHDAKPVLTLLVLCGCGLLWLGLHWVSLSPTARRQHLVRIAGIEEARSLPPASFQDQARWLADHRLARLQGLSLLLGMSAVIGGSEGIARRRRDPLGGMRLRNWTIGLVSVALTPGLVGSLVLCPLPWSIAVVAEIGAGWSLLTTYALLSGRPYVP